MKKFIISIFVLILLTGCGKFKSLLNSDNDTSTEKNEQIVTEKKNETGSESNQDNDIKKKELELKEKELELKEKELNLNNSKNESRRESEYKPEHRGEKNYRGTPGDYPEGSIRYLTYNDVAGLSKWQLSIMRNEIYARHGYIFTANMDIKRHFETKSWYYPSYYNVDGMLSKVEKANINFIKSFE
mgnify:CR=1 FL=1